MYCCSRTVGDIIYLDSAGLLGHGEPRLCLFQLLWENALDLVDKKDLFLGPQLLCEHHFVRWDDSDSDGIMHNWTEENQAVLQA